MSIHRECSCFSIFGKVVDRLIKYTERFEWDELPTKDPDSGETTMAGWIDKSQLVANKLYKVTLVSHYSQSLYRLITNHELMLETWYPWGMQTSPYFDIFNFIQVRIYTLSLTKNNNVINFSSVILIWLRDLDANKIGEEIFGEL